ncbi:MAG: type II toxin-antitoxin system VapC family toxin [Rhodospirillaceae bacterium]
MKLLLDTHIFLWLIAGDTRLSASTTAAIRNPDHEVLLSVVSLWEAMIKHQLGKLPLPHPPALYLPEQRERHQVESLPLDEACVGHLARLPPIHRDPFDRMLIAQALAHDLTIVTVDPLIIAYPVPVLHGAREQPSP